MSSRLLQLRWLSHSWERPSRLPLLVCTGLVFLRGACSRYDSAGCLSEEDPCLCSWTFQESPTATESHKTVGTPENLGGRRWVIPPGQVPRPVDRGGADHTHTPTPDRQLLCQLGALCSSESTQPGTSITETVLPGAADASKNSPHLFRLWEGKGSECPQRLLWRGEAKEELLFSAGPPPHPTAL